MARTAVQYSAQFDADIEYNPTDPVSLTVDDADHEHLTYWGIDDDGRCFFLTFIDEEYLDGFTEEA